MKKLLLVSLLFYHLFLVITASNYCPTDSEYNVFAADNLNNGTIRLYNGLQYTDLLLFRADANITHGVEESSSSLSLPWIDVSSGKFLAVIQSQGSILNVYQNLPPLFEFTDNWTRHVSVFSLCDQIGQEFTFIMISERSKKHQHSLTGWFLYLNSQIGMIIKEIPLQADYEDSEGRLKDHSDDEVNPGLFVRVVAAVRVYIGEDQYLFNIINTRLFYALILVENFDDFDQPETIQMMDDTDTQRFHRGQIPLMTAAFVLQPQANKITIVLVMCNKYCPVHWVHDNNASYFDFDSCPRDLNRWPNVADFFANKTIPNQDLTRFKNFDVFEQKIRNFKMKILFLMWIIYKMIMTVHKSLKGTMAGILKITGHKIFYLISVVIIIIFGASVGFLMYDRQSEKILNVAKVERRALKRQRNPPVQNRVEISQPEKGSLVTVEQKISLFHLDKIE